MFNYLLALVLFVNFIVLDDRHHYFSKFIFNNHLNYQLDKLNINLDIDLDRIDCKEYEKNVSLIKKVAEGAVKEIWLGKWSTYGYIAVSFLKNSIYSTDFIHNINMLRNFTKFKSNYTTIYLGNCDQRILFTKFYKFGPLSNFYYLIKQPYLFKSPLKSMNCFQFCIHYAKTIDYLHHSPLGIRVMCDSNDLAKLASQFLINDNLNGIVVNDLDALPDATHNTIKCGNKSLIGDLIAPEQAQNNFYDQQIDIYKLPYLCNYLISLCPKNDLLNQLVNQLHTKCLDQLSFKRPSSNEIVREYLRINYTVFN